MTLSLLLKQTNVMGGTQKENLTYLLECLNGPVVYTVFFEIIPGSLHDMIDDPLVELTLFDGCRSASCVSWDLGLWEATNHSGVGHVERSVASTSQGVRSFSIGTSRRRGGLRMAESVV